MLGSHRAATPPVDAGESSSGSAAGTGCNGASSLRPNLHAPFPAQRRWRVAPPWAEIVSTVNLLLLCFFFFLVRDQVCVTLPFVAALSSTLPRTRWLLHALTSCGIDARDQAIIAGVTTFSGGGAIRCHSSSSLHSIRVRAYCHFRGDTAADVAEGRRPSAFQLPRLPSPFAAHCLAAVTGKNLLSLCTRTPLLTLRTCALLHGFDHAHFDHGYLGTKGLSSA